MVHMNTFVILLRGVNVGGKNKVPMAELRQCLEGLGYQKVTTYIASGNAMLDADESAAVIAGKIENILSHSFKLDSPRIKVLVLTHTQLQNIVNHAPKGFGQSPDTYYSDVVFVIDKKPADIMLQFETQPEVDAVWEGGGVVYSQRLSAMRTKSRLGRIAAKPIYLHLTIRNWNTVTKLLALVESRNPT